MHTIRLRAPWTCQALDGPAGDGEKGLAPLGQFSAEHAVEVPGTWAAALGDDYRGRARFVRRFGRPSGLDPGTRVLLVVESIEGCAAEVRLDARTLGSALDTRDAPFRFDITAALAFRNELHIDVTQTDPQAPPGGIGQVRIEITD